MARAATPARDGPARPPGYTGTQAGREAAGPLGSRSPGACMLDLIVRNARLPRTQHNVDIAVRDGRIVDVAATVAGDAGETLDAGA